MRLMSLAGYNPRTALTFWQKMAASSSAKIPAFMSDHPSDSKRISDIEKALPSIEQKYASYINAGKKSTTSKKSTTKKTTKKKK
mgnify:CR=1 FL=1